jgi:hypothetical protein
LVVRVDDGLRDRRLGQIELVRINGDGVEDRRDLVVLSASAAAASSRS